MSPVWILPVTACLRKPLEIGGILPQSAVLTSYTSIKAQINCAIISKIKAYFEAACVNKSYTPIVNNGLINCILPRWTEAAIFQLVAGHGYLAAHLHGINMIPLLECTLCEDVYMNVDHLLICAALDHSPIDEVEQQSFFACTGRRATKWPQQPRVGVS